MKSLFPNPPNGFGGPPGNLPPLPLGGPSPGPTGSYRLPGGACGSYPLCPRPPNSGSSKVGCIPPPPNPGLGNPPPPIKLPLSGSLGPNPGGFRSSWPILKGARGCMKPRGGRLTSYSSSKSGGGKSPIGLRGGAASGSSNGYGRAGCGKRSSRRGSAPGLRRACSSSRKSRTRSRSRAPSVLAASS